MYSPSYGSQKTENALCVNSQRTAKTAVPPQLSETSDHSKSHPGFCCNGQTRRRLQAKDFLCVRDETHETYSMQETAPSHTTRRLSAPATVHLLAFGQHLSSIIAQSASACQAFFAVFLEFLCVFIHHFFHFMHLFAYKTGAVSLNFQFLFPKD